MAAAGSTLFYQSTFWRELRAACLRRDGYICVVPGCGERATHADHIDRRPHTAARTSFDTLANLRSLCATHDAQVKETASGARRGDGAFKVRGSDANGWPLDPRRR